MNIALLVIAIVEAVIILGLIVYLAINAASINRIYENTKQIASKNVEVEDIPLSGSGSTKALAHNINVMKSNLISFIESTKGNVITLTDAIDALSKSTTSNEHATEQTTNSILTVAEKANEQLQLVKDNLEMIESNDEQLKVIDTSMHSIQQTLHESVNSCEVGIKNLEKYESDMKVVSDNLDKSMNILNEFNEEIKEINTIGEIVVDLSEELQLLALNASIEAARAGEAGKGFAVVSQEMSILSGKTKENMDMINGILTKVTESSQFVNESINNCSTTFSASSEIFVDVSDSFRVISGQSQQINKKMNDMSGKYENIASNSSVSREKAENIFSASETISDSTRDVVAISEETSANSAHMTQNVESLESMLISIRNLIKQFNTGVTPSSKNRSNKVVIAYFSKLDNFFWYQIRRGVLYAQKELKDNNVEIKYFPYKDDIEEKQFPSDVSWCIENGVDAIIYPGFLELANKEIAQAANKGIKIFTYNCDCNSSIKRVSCYEPDQEEAGELAAKAAAKAIKRAGNIYIIAGDRKQAVNSLRYNAFVNYITKNYKNIKIVGTTEVTNIPEDTYKTELEILKNHPEIDLIYSTTGMQIQLAKAIEDSGRAGKVRAVIFDHNDEIFSYINKGVIAAAIDHDPFSQGHDPIIYIYNNIVDGLVLPSDRIKCKASVVDSDNIKEHLVS